MSHTPRGTFAPGIARIQSGAAVVDPLAGVMDSAAGMTVPADHFERQLPQAEWRHLSGNMSHSMSTEMAGTGAVVSGEVYATVHDSASNTEQELLGVVRAMAGSSDGEHFAVIGIGSTPVHGRAYAKDYFLVRLRPGVKGAEPVVVARVPRVPQDTRQPVVVGRGPLRDREDLPDLSSMMSANHFQAEVRETRDGPRVVVTDMGSSNGTTVFIPNRAENTDHPGQRKLRDAWGGEKAWALNGNQARDLRPSRMRPVTTEDNVSSPGTESATLDAQRDPNRLRFDERMDDRLPVRSRGEMNRQFGLDAAHVATVVVAAAHANVAEHVTVLDRGDIPYGEEWSLYPGGPLLSHNQRYLLADDGYLRAALQARGSGDYSILQRHVAEHGGVRVVDQNASSKVTLGRAGWTWRLAFGEEAAKRVETNRVVSAQHVDIEFGWGVGSQLKVTDLGSSNGTEVIIGKRRTEATAQAAGNAAMIEYTVSNY